jgi:3-dehydroquinate synthase
MDTHRLRLGDRSYPIYVGIDIAENAGRLLKNRGVTAPPILVSEYRIMRLHGQRLLQALEREFGSVPVIRIKAGESSKSQSGLQKLYDRLFRLGADRTSCLLAFGGGVITDLTGFAAATFMRGIRYASIPTTLLAQVDSSIGGKVGINVLQGKNLIGAFHHPIAVLSDVSWLDTLDDRELASGIYEVIKCGAIKSQRLLRRIDEDLQDLLDRRCGALQTIVSWACRIKADVVAADEREQEFRMILNFGHTIGHALEAATGYRRFTHGEAVAWGMLAALSLGTELNLLAPLKARRLENLIRRVGSLPTLRGIETGEVWASLLRDKKIRGGKIRMVFLSRLGRAEVHPDIDAKHLKSFLGRFLLSSS